MTTLPLLCLVIWCLLEWWFQGQDFTRSWEMLWWRNLPPRGQILWVYLLLLVVTIPFYIMGRFTYLVFRWWKQHRRFATMSEYSHGINDAKKELGERRKAFFGFARVGVVVFLVTALATTVLVGRLWTVAWDADKDIARYFAQDVSFRVSSLESEAIPKSLRAITGGGVETEKCGDLKAEGIQGIQGPHDVFGCVRQGQVSMNWKPRVGSYSGAKLALSRGASGTQGASLNEMTVSYLVFNNEKKPDRWSGVIDGSGINVPIAGVAEWSGQGNPTQCYFDKQYDITRRAFAGKKLNSLSNLMAERFPDLYFQMSDVWGYCKDVEGQPQEPVVVIPVTVEVKPDGMNRTVRTAGGIVTVRGNNGEIQLTHVKNVESGEYPGPVYPSSLAATQREMSTWAAGREGRDKNFFGMDPVSSEIQAGNVSEYFLSNAAGRLELVTPVTLRGSNSEAIVGFMIVRGDEVRSGKLNPLDIYVMSDGDRNQVVIDTMEATARVWLAGDGNQGLLLAIGARLLEFTPGTDSWIAYLEVKGRVRYYLKISPTSAFQPEIVPLDDGSGQVTPDLSGKTTDGSQIQASPCGEPLDSLTPAQLVDCSKRLADELGLRASGGVWFPSNEHKRWKNSS